MSDSLPSTLRVEVEIKEGAIARIQLGAGPPHIPAILSDWFAAYLHGQTAPLPPLHWPSLPPFTRNILHRIAQIPFGQTTTYGQLDPAARAVGNVCNKNPFPLLIPCHRVLGATSLGGYAFGTELKQKLLDYEKCIS